MDSPELITGLQVYTWAGFALAAAVGTGGYVSRWKTHRKLFSDDWLHALAVFFLCGYAICQTFEFQYELQDEFDPPLLLGVYDRRLKAYAIVSTVLTSFYWAAVFLSKGVFLALFARVLRFNPAAFSAHYWITAVLTVIGFLAAFLSQFFICGGNAKYFTNVENDDVCTGYLKYAQDISIISLVCNVVTYILVISLTPWVFTKLRPLASQKVKILAGLFVACGIITVDVLAWYYSTWADMPGPAAELFYLEALLCVILSALPAYIRRVGSSDHWQAGGAMDGDADMHGNTNGAARDEEGGAAAAAGSAAGGGRLSVPGGRADKTTSMATSDATTEREKENSQNQFLRLDVPATTRSYWQIPGLRTSTRTADMITTPE